ncbi:MAG: prolipoprotein diacylglyceryl transferase [Eubacterium sp.]|nr:prolipoprotein diacylglyceryl transferase [Eubacterium sp.]
MHNEILTIGPFTIYGYGLMIAIGIISAYFVGEYRAKKANLSPDMIFSLVIWCVIAGYMGSKILYSLTIIDQVIEDPTVLLNFADGWVVYGGIIGGIIGGWLCCKVHKADFIRYFDLVIPSVALAQGFGRIGCFLAGCCYGRECSGPFCVTFHTSNYAPNDVPLVPTQLISSACDFILFFILIILASKVKKKGLVAGVYLLLYSIGRFVLEFFRGDIERGSVGVLSTSQFIGIFMALAGVIIIVCALKNKEIEREDTDDTIVQ